MSVGKVQVALPYKKNRRMRTCVRERRYWRLLQVTGTFPCGEQRQKYGYRRTAATLCLKE